MKESPRNIIGPVLAATLLTGLSANAADPTWNVGTATWDTSTPY